MPSTYQEITARLLLSLFLGGLIGLERQYHHKPAGFRTMIMISIGSCLFSLLSGVLDGAEGSFRIAANVVTGIGFIGAGVIFRSSSRINGITTAAAIWSVAAVGMSVGVGQYFMATIATLLILSVLSVLPYVEQKMETKNLYREYHISFHDRQSTHESWQKMLTERRLKFRLLKESLSPIDVTVSIEVWGKPEDHRSFVQAIANEPSFKNLDYTT